MLATLRTAYTDSRAGDLSWALGRDPMPALAELDVRIGPHTVQLRLLGASHQVLLDDHGDHGAHGHGRCSETVACLPGAATPLPLGVSRRSGDWEYAFAARVDTLEPDEFAARARELLTLVGDHPHGLAGTFPGSPYAFTALVAQPWEGQVQWRTWHAYPEEGRLVSTRTRAGVRAAALV